MTAQPNKKYITPEEYLLLERDASVKHEYLNGEVFAIAGAKMAHIRICGNLIRSLGNQLADRDCQAFQSDFRTHVPETGLYTYPDITVVCGKVELAQDGFLDTLLNPTLIIEVLSPSTAEYDRGAKFDHYKTIHSLKEYVLVWQDKRRVARHTRRGDDSWILTDFIGDESQIEMLSIGSTLSMSDIYDKVENLSPH